MRNCGSLRDLVPKVLNVTIPKLPYLSLFRGPGCAVNKSQIFDFIEDFSIVGACECRRRTRTELVGLLQRKRSDLRPLGKIRWREVRRRQLVVSGLGSSDIRL